MKYQMPHDQNEHLPNRLSLHSAEAIALAEFDGFLKAEILLTEELTRRRSLRAVIFKKLTNWR